MTKRKTLLALLLGFVMAMSATACGGGDFKLAHFDGTDIENGYDTGLLYMNRSEFWAGDSGVIWVPEDRDSEYGGYFYQYMSEAGGVANQIPSTADGKTPSAETGAAEYTSHIVVTRSKDLNDWQVCGALDHGMGLRVGKDEWAERAFWAPECVYDKVSGKYFLYFSALSYQNNADRRALGAIYSDAPDSDDVSRWNRFYLGIGVSDSPVGPFSLVSSENVYGDADRPNPNGDIITGINPAFMLDKEFDELFYTDEFKARPDFATLDESCFAAIDIHPWFDDNGDFYVYFVKHASSANPEGNTIWGIKMKDMITPDYSTITMLYGNYFAGATTPNAHGQVGQTIVRVEYKGSTANDPNYPRHLSTSYDRYTYYADEDENGAGAGDDANMSDGGVNEAPQMLTTTDKDGKKVYLLTYSPRGVGNPRYDVKFGYSYSPLGPFIKPRADQGATILGIDTSNNFMSHLGHAQFLNVDGEDWIVHWEWGAPFAGKDHGRIYALDKMTWVYEDSLGFPVPVSGPTKSLQPLPSVYTGYRNVAPRAKVSATHEVDGSAQYLNDGLIVTSSRFEGREFRASKNSTKITLEFPEATAIRGILLYNSYTFRNAFQKVSRITFTLAETPSWHEGNHKTCSISDLPYNLDAYKTGGSIQPGSAALATFDEIKVTKIEIEFESNDMLGDGDELRVSEIVVLGK